MQPLLPLIFSFGKSVAAPVILDQRADVVLRTSDNVDFGAHKLLLSLASPVFDSMFSLPQPSEISKEPGGLPIVSLSEDSHTLKSLLSFCYPSEDPILESLAEVGALLEVTRKYEMEGVMKRARKLLVAPDFLQKQPLRTFAIAHQCRLEEEIKLSAHSYIRLPPFEQYCVELEHLPSGFYNRLMQYSSKCRNAASRVGSSDSMLWVPFDGTGYIWFRCTKCTVTGDRAIRLTANGGIVAKPRQWWIDYMQAVSGELGKIPYFHREAISLHQDVALVKAAGCDMCKLSAHADMRKFNRLYAAEVARVVSEVGPNH